MVVYVPLIHRIREQGHRASCVNNGDYASKQGTLATDVHSQRAGSSVTCNTGMQGSIYLSTSFKPLSADIRLQDLRSARRFCGGRRLGSHKKIEALQWSHCSKAGFEVLVDVELALVFGVRPLFL